MALTSTMLPLGTKAPQFSLLNNHFGPKGTVIMFICNHCPYVKHVLPKLLEVTEKYKALGINFIAISSNDINSYPEDSPEKMAELAKQLNFNFPYLFDETQEIAKAYQAACTPDFYLFNANKECVYRGRFDESSPKNDKLLTGKDLCDAIDNMLAGKSISEEQFPSMGCGIKWKAEIPTNQNKNGAGN